MSLAFSFEALTAVPTEDCAGALHQAYKSKLLSSFSKLLSYAADALNINATPILKQLEALSVCSPPFLSPWTYHSYFKLRSALKNDDIQGVESMISSFNQLSSNRFVQDLRKIQAGFCEDWEETAFVEEVTVAFGSDKLQASMPCLKKFSSFPSEVDAAIKIITKADPVFAEELEMLVASINLVESKVNVGATSPKFFGAIYLSLPDGELARYEQVSLLEHLVHETSHLYLNAILAHDPLVLNQADERFSSPIREDLRPMLGIYHAMFVLSRVIRIFKKIIQFDLYPDTVFLDQCVRNLIKKYEITYKTVQDQARLSDLGRRIFETTRDCAGY